MAVLTRKPRSGSGRPPEPPHHRGEDGGWGEYEPWSWGWIHKHYGAIIQEWCQSGNTDVKAFRQLILDALFAQSPTVGTARFPSNASLRNWWKPDPTGRWGKLGREPPPPEPNEFEVMLEWEADNPEEQIGNLLVRSVSLWDELGIDGNPVDIIRRGEMFGYLYSALAKYSGEGTDKRGRHVETQYFLQHGLFQAYEFLKDDAHTQAILRQEVARYNETMPDRVGIKYRNVRPWSFIMAPGDRVISMHVAAIMDYTVEGK